MSLQSLTGFRDFLPGECRKREELFGVWREAARRFGFEPYDGPPLEPLELYTRKSGAEIVEQLYHFVDKGGREVALRPEMTPTLARMVGAAQRQYKKPIKWFSVSQVFRYERAQRGRLREHFQWNADIVGEAGRGAEVELLALLLSSLRDLGLGPADVALRLSDRGYWMDFLKARGVPEDRWYAVLQAIDKMERSTPEQTLERLGDLAGAAGEAMAAAAPTEGLREVLDGLAAYGLADYVVIDYRIVRGLAYYTGPVFEVHDRKGELRAVAGGGRYDGLLKALAGVDLPALGFGMGDVVIGELLADRGLGKGKAGERAWYLVVAEEEARAEALKLAARLRAAGCRVDYPLGPTKVGRQFEKAAELGCTRALVLDGAWVRSGVCGCKDLAARTQESVRPEWEGGELVLKPAKEEKGQET